MLKMTIDNEEVVSDKDITINEEMLSASSTILNNVYPKEWEEDKDYTSRFYYPQDYSKALIQRSYVTQEAEAGTTIQVNGSVTLTDVDTTKNSRVLRLLGQTSQTGTPTPSSPIPVNVVSGDNEILVNGSNFITFKNFNEVTQNGVTTTPNNSELKLSGTVTQAGALFNSQSLGLMLPKGTYTITYKIASGSVIRPTGDVAFYLRNGTNNIATVTIYQILSNNKFSQTFTINSNTLLYFYVYSNYGNIVFDNTVLQIQLSKGSTATNYEPYIGNTYNINLPVENLLPFQSQDFTINNVRYYCNNGNLYLNGTSTGETYQTNQAFKDNFSFYLEAGTYTFKQNILDSGSANYFGKSIVRYSNNSSIAYINNSNSQATFTLTERTQVYLGFYIYQKAFTNETFNLQLEKGPKANKYTPYGTTPIELCKIGNYQDYIYKDGDKWYLHKEIGKIVLNGSETGWAVNNSVFYRNFNGKIKGKIGMFSNSYSYKSVAWTSLGNYEMSDDASTATIFIKDTDYTTTSAFKGMLATNQPSLYYILSTPTNTEITYEPLIEQLNALSSQ